MTTSKHKHTTASVTPSLSSRPPDREPHGSGPAVDYNAAECAAVVVISFGALLALIAVEVILDVAM